MPRDDVPQTRSLDTEFAGFLAEHLLPMYRYRHLVGYLANGCATVNEKSAIQGPRAAAVLALLWAQEDLRLKKCIQKTLGLHLGIRNNAEIGRILNPLCESGLVRLVRGKNYRVKVYEITEDGKKQLNEWLGNWYAPALFREAIRAAAPDSHKIAKLFEALQKDARTILGC